MAADHAGEQGEQQSQPKVGNTLLDLSAARRKPELFVAGECLAEGPRQTLQTMLHEAVHALAHARGAEDTSPGGQVPQQA